MVEGRIFWDPALPEIPRAERAAYFDAMNATLADLHRIDPEVAGLGDFGKPGNYLERQITRWTRSYVEERDAPRDANLDRLIDWLPKNIPLSEGTSVIHGDFRLDNLIWHPSEPVILAVLDWELSTLGDPLADFAYHLMMYRLPKLTIPGLAGQDLGALGLPSEEAYVGAYRRRSANPKNEDLEFHLAFNLFRFAAICHGIKGRLARGNAASAHARDLVSDLPVLAELAWRQALRAGAR